MDCPDLLKVHSKWSFGRGSNCNMFRATTKHSTSVFSHSDSRPVIRIPQCGRRYGQFNEAMHPSVMQRTESNQSTHRPDRGMPEMLNTNPPMSPQYNSSSPVESVGNIAIWGISSYVAIWGISRLHFCVCISATRYFSCGLLIVWH
jgi:hypothetical protein